MAIRIVLADDHPLIVNGLRHLLEDREDFEIAAVCVDGNEILGAVRTYKPDVLILDLRMPGKDGIAVAREIHECGIPVKVVVLTGQLNEKEATQCLRLGVKGIVLKEMAPELLVNCLYKVCSGGEWIERSSSGKILHSMLHREKRVEEIKRRLTEREFEMVTLVGLGLRNKEIAEKLSISEETVKKHLYRIYQKLQIEARSQLIRYAHVEELI